MASGCRIDLENRIMTGYTVHTGASKKFVSGWDRIFSGDEANTKSKSAAKSPAAKPAAQKKATVKKKAAKKSSVKTVAKTASTNAT